MPCAKTFFGAVNTFDLDVTFLWYLNTSVKADHSGGLCVCETSRSEALMNDLREDNVYSSSFFSGLHFQSNYHFLEMYCLWNGCLQKGLPWQSSLKSVGSWRKALPFHPSYLHAKQIWDLFLLIYRELFASEIKNCEAELRELLLLKVKNTQ